MRPAALLLLLGRELIALARSPDRRHLRRVLVDAAAVPLAGDLGRHRAFLRGQRSCPLCHARVLLALLTHANHAGTASRSRSYPVPSSVCPRGGSSTYSRQRRRRVASR